MASEKNFFEEHFIFGTVPPLTKQPAAEAAKQPAAEAAKQLAAEAAKQPAAEAAKQPAAEAAKQPAAEAAKQPAAEAAKQPAAEAAKQPAAEAAKQPAAEAAKQPATETAKRPTTETAKQPAAEAAKRLTDCKNNALEVKALKDRIAELERLVAKTPSNIEERIAYFKRKQHLTERFEKFNEQIARLREIIEIIEDVNATAEDFSDSPSNYRLQVLEPGSYSQKAVLSITKKELIVDVMELLVAKMETTANRLKDEIAE